MAAKATVLIVDDEPQMREFVRRVLVTESLHLLEATDGADALEVAGRQATPIDLLLTDLRMPGMDGQRLAAALRPHCPSMKVLFLTGYSDSLFVHDEPLPEGTAFEDKPVSSKRLREAVSLLLYGTLHPPTRILPHRPASSPKPVGERDLRA
jgi:CheY-like chemotaxis protein